MAQFAYKARDSAGHLLEGVLETADSGAAASELFRRGVTPVDITPAHAPAKPAESDVVKPPSASLFRERITPLDLIMFSRQMYTLLKAGVPIMRALGGLQQSTTNTAFAAVIGDLRDSLDAGRDLATALGKHPRVFSLFFVNMVRVGEMTGQLEEIFLRMFHHIEFEKFMREQVKSAIRYPTFVVATMAVAMVVINLFVIPAFAKVYKSFNAKLPLITQLLIDFSDFMVATWPLLVTGAVGAFFGFRYWTRTTGGRLRWDEMKLKLPVAGKIIVKATLARFARSFALALHSGVPVVQALTTVAQTVDNAFIAAKVEKMREGVERGESVLHTASAAGVFTPSVLQMIAVGEESGALDNLLQEIADMYQRDVEYELKALSSQIEPILIICLAVLVLILALGVFLPIWDLGRAMVKS
jgi:MSHA biogenesis protein MshG